MFSNKIWTNVKVTHARTEETVETEKIPTRVTVWTDILELTAEQVLATTTLQ